jgi:hypothetical protein
MSTIARTPFHRNRNAVIVFDAGLIRHNPALREIRAQFGAGILRSFPTSRCEFTAQDAQEAVVMFIETVQSTPLPPISPDQLAKEISESIRRSQALGRRQDALLAKLHGIRPICGGSPEADARSEFNRRIDEIMNGIDDPAGNPVTDADIAAVNGAVG